MKNNKILLLSIFFATQSIFAMEDKKVKYHTLDFKIVLYYKNKPNINFKNLTTAWLVDGYTSELLSNSSPEELAILRGGTGVFLKPYTNINRSVIPSYYEDMAALKINYADTYFINHAAAWSDFKTSNYEVKMTFRMIDADAKTLASRGLNELMATLLGINEATKPNAVWLDYAGILVGKANLTEFTGWAMTRKGHPEPESSYPMFFGVLTKRQGNTSVSWTKGLNLKNHNELWLETPKIESISSDDLAGLFNAAVQVHKKSIYKAKETLETNGVNYRFITEKLGNEANLKLVKLK